MRKFHGMMIADEQVTQYTNVDWSGKYIHYRKRWTKDSTHIK